MRLGRGRERHATCACALATMMQRGSASPRLSTSMPSACAFMIANRTLELAVLDTLPD